MESNALPLLVFGTGQLASLVLQFAEETGRRVEAFVVDDEFHCDTTLAGREIIPFSALSNRFPPGSCEISVTVGYRSMRARRQVFDTLHGLRYSCPNVIARGAYVASNAQLGRGNIVFPNTTIEPGAVLGDNNVLWSGGIVCHDCRVGHHNYFAPSVTISGNCALADLSFFGTGVSIVDGIRIGGECYFRAGAVVFHDAATLGKYAGNPARRCGEIDAATGVCVDSAKRRNREPE